MANQNGISVPFEQIIQQLMSPENQNRAQAEELFNQAKQQPDLLVSQLTAVLRQSQATEARGLCAVLLRKVHQCGTIRIGARPSGNSISITFVDLDPARGVRE